MYVIQRSSSSLLLSSLELSDTKVYEPALAAPSATFEGWRPAPNPEPGKSEAGVSPVSKGETKTTAQGDELVLPKP